MVCMIVHVLVYRVGHCVWPIRYRKRRNIGVQKIWRFCLKSGRIKYWRIFNLAFGAWHWPIIIIIIITPQ